MIKSLTANKNSFNSIIFKKGLNVIVADKTIESTDKDSRNGIGKTTLIEIINFCFGGGVKKNKSIFVESLNDWDFSLKMEINSNEIRINRSLANPNIFSIDDPNNEISSNANFLNTTYDINLKEFNSNFGALFFGLDKKIENKYAPTFRSLLSYVIRHNNSAYLNPFEQYKNQNPWDSQVNIAYLLDLCWEYISEQTLINVQKKGLKLLRDAIKDGLMNDLYGLGDLEAKRIQLKQIVNEDLVGLKSFNVHPQYKQIEDESNTLTQEIHELVNKKVKISRTLELYEKSIQTEEPPNNNQLEKIYNEIGIELGNIALHRLEEVKDFHEKIIENRKVFLTTEIRNLKSELIKLEKEMSEKSVKRSSLMEILNTHGALNEYTLLQKRYSENLTNLNNITNLIDNMKQLKDSENDLKIKTLNLNQKMRQDFDERTSIREEAIQLFNNYSQKLYEAPGKLVIDVKDEKYNGYQFDVEIDRAGSNGIEKMKIFCFDLMVASLWSKKQSAPRFLIHDSTIFDGVDERQIAKALELAEEESTKNGFQYICTMNSDTIPYEIFSKTFDIKKHIIKTLTDTDVKDYLLGISF